MSGSETVFISDFPTSTIAEYTRRRGHPVIDVMKPLPRGVGRVRRGHLRMQLPGASVWFDVGTTVTAATRNVVVGDRPEMFSIARWLRDRFPQVRVVLWCWNPIPASWIPADVADFDVATFDPGDAARYRFRLVSTYYFREFAQYASPAKEHDLVFVGLDKGRRASIHSVEALVNAGGGRSHVKIAEPGDPHIPYTSLLEEAGRSRGALDIVQEGQRCMTLRAMEALFLGVKLVTNNEAMLIDEHYPGENVWLLGQNSAHSLTEWLRGEPVPTNPAVLDWYDFDSWLRRLLGAVD